MTQPDTCDKAGGAIGMWVKVIDCPNNESCGIIRTIQGDRFHGFLIRCFEGNIRYYFENNSKKMNIPMLKRIILSTHCCFQLLFHLKCFHDIVLYYLHFISLYVTYSSTLSTL